MSCSDIKFDAAKDPHRCKCQAAVKKTYEGLLNAGQPATVALEAAKIVYHHHHPEDSKDLAGLTVERWIYEGRFH